MRNNHINVQTEPTPLLAVRTYAPREHVSRLGQYRLKDAARRRDLAIAEAHTRYAEEVRAIAGRDHASALALRRGDTANPSLANPFGHALERSCNRPRPRWMVSITALLRGTGRG